MIWMYHNTKAKNGQIFSKEDVEKLGDGWVDTPAKFKPEKKKEPKKGVTK